MTRDEIIKIAKQCGYWSGQTVEMNDVGLERFAALVAAAEREKCAKLCDPGEELPNTAYLVHNANVVMRRCAAAIRARGAV